MADLTLNMRFDMRAPDFAASPGALYPAAVDMAAWADERGFSSIGISEHHATEDGYCPAPLLLGSAIAARTQHVKIRFGVMLLTLHHPLRAAEEIAVLDNLSEGRVIPMYGAGYRMEEFEMFGIDPKKRAKIMGPERWFVPGHIRIHTHRSIWVARSKVQRDWQPELQMIFSPQQCRWLKYSSKSGNDLGKVGFLTRTMELKAHGLYM